MRCLRSSATVWTVRPMNKHTCTIVVDHIPFGDDMVGGGGGGRTPAAGHPHNSRGCQEQQCWAAAELVHEVPQIFSNCLDGATYEQAHTPFAVVCKCCSFDSRNFCACWLMQCQCQHRSRLVRQEAKTGSQGRASQQTRSASLLPVTGVAAPACRHRSYMHALHMEWQLWQCLHSHVTLKLCKSPKHHNTCKCFVMCTLHTAAGSAAVTAVSMPL
jgi:hypothetical protein